MFRNVKELIEITKEKQILISDVMIAQEMEVTEKTKEDIFQQMDHNLSVMEAAVQKGLEGVTSQTGLTGGDAVKLHTYIRSGKSLSVPLILDAVSKAVATNEVNAAMGTICATPTAGSAGVVPGTLFAVKEKLNPTREQMIRFLFTAGAFGFVVANNASISGAAGGCQAEVGSASGMAAAVPLLKWQEEHPNKARKPYHYIKKYARYFVCDPVAGLVEVPCVKRNAMGASNAMIAADMALAGITSRIPCDEVIDAMYKIGTKRCQLHLEKHTRAV
nr:L-serine ammonia-lyase, iron-sulfur-dependent, subunit alpha [Bacillus subtilis]